MGTWPAGRVLAATRSRSITEMLKIASLRPPVHLLYKETAAPRRQSLPALRTSAPAAKSLLLSPRGKSLHHRCREISVIAQLRQCELSMDESWFPAVCNDVQMIA